MSKFLADSFANSTLLVDGSIIITPSLKFSEVFEDLLVSYSNSLCLDKDKTDPSDDSMHDVEVHYCEYLLDYFTRNEFGRDRVAIKETHGWDFGQLDYDNCDR